VSSKRVITIARCPSRLKPCIIIRHLDNSLIEIPKPYIVDLGMMLTAEPQSTRIRMTFCPQMYPVRSNGQLCDLDPNNKSSFDECYESIPGSTLGKIACQFPIARAKIYRPIDMNKCNLC